MKLFEIYNLKMKKLGKIGQMCNTLAGRSSRSKGSLQPSSSILDNIETNFRSDKKGIERVLPQYEHHCLNDERKVGL